jgi:hypothetical protein
MAQPRNTTNRKIKENKKDLHKMWKVLTMATFSRHASDRIEEIKLELTENELIRINAGINYVKSETFGVDIAIRVLRIDRHLGETTSNTYDRMQQNGNNIWLIIRNNYVATVMRRRDDQPRTARAMRVDMTKVISYTEN